MKALGVVAIALMIAVPASAQKARGQRKGRRAPATQPAAAAQADPASSQPASTDVPLSPDRSKAYKVAIAKIKMSSIPKLAWVRQDFQKYVDARDAADAKEAGQTREQLNLATKQRAYHTYAGHPVKAQRRQKIADAEEQRLERIYQDHADKLKADDETRKSFDRLEDAYRATLQFKVNLEYEQWTTAANMKKQAKSDMGNLKWLTMTPEIRKELDPVEASVREGVAKLP